MDQSTSEIMGQLVKTACSLEGSLARQLTYIADQIRLMNPHFSDAVDAFVDRLTNAHAGDKAPAVGDPMPGFLLPDDQGRLVSLERLLETAPVVVAFHRGHWCPYCRTNMIGLAALEADIKPVQIVAVSAEVQAYSRRLKAEAKAGFPFLTDMGNGYALSLNLAIWVDDDMAALIQAADNDIPRYQGQEGWVLPIPSVFVVGQDGLIKARHIDPDYRRRLEYADLKAFARQALATS